MDRNNKTQNSMWFLNKKTLITGLLVGFISYIGACAFALVFFGTIIYKKYSVFLKTAQTSRQELIGLAQQIDPNFDKNITLLILGSDKLASRPGSPELTDTMLLANINQEQQKINLLSLPRDLWSEAYKTKINALYEYGKEKYPSNPEKFPAEAITDITQTNIDHTIVITINDLGKLIDIIGGLEINVKTGFTDDEFPRDDVDVTKESDPAILYETISFEPGLQHMDGETALKFIRSRHSEDLESGTDLARTNRQQQVIQTLFTKMSNPKLYWHHPEIAGYLFKFYQNRFEQYLPLTKLLSIIATIGKNIQDYQIQTLTLSQYPEDEQGIIYHPENLYPYQNQWVYVVHNQQALQQLIQNNF